MSTLEAGLGIALVGAIALNAGFVLQAHGAAAAPTLTIRHPLRSALALVSARRWAIGLGAGMAGWLLYLVALGLAPLSLVQAVSAGAVCLTVPIAAVVARARPTRAEGVGALIAAGGLAALAASLPAADGNRPAHPAALPLGLLAVAVILIAARAIVRPSASLGGLACGAGYGLGDVLSKLLLSRLPHHPGLVQVLTAPLLVPTLLCHAGAFLLLQRTFQLHGTRSTVTTVGTMTAAMNLLPIGAGVLLLGDPFPRQPLGAAVRLVAFAAVVLGARILAREQAAAEAEPGPERGAAPARATTPAIVAPHATTDVR
jgi:hypothetical protein